MKKIEIFTDGACRGNPGPGGWGALLRHDKKIKKIYGAVAHTTNNQMELMAAVKALEALKQKCQVEITSDSEYLRQGITTWIKKWKKNNWRTSARTPVKNQALWQELDALAIQHHVTWHWVKGHSGHPENELADELANLAIEEMLAGKM